MILTSHPDVRIPTLADRATLFARFADLMARGELDPAPLVDSMLLHNASATLSDPSVVFADLVKTTCRLQMLRAGRAEVHGDIEAAVVLAEQDRDDLLWTLLQGPTAPCGVCRRSVAEVAAWKAAGHCDAHGGAA